MGSTSPASPISGKPEIGRFASPRKSGERSCTPKLEQMKAISEFFPVAPGISPEKRALACRVASEYGRPRFIARRKGSRGDKEHCGRRAEAFLRGRGGGPAGDPHPWQPQLGSAVAEAGGYVAREVPRAVAGSLRRGGGARWRAAH